MLDESATGGAFASFNIQQSYFEIYIYGEEGVWVQLLGGPVARAHIILVLRGCIGNAPAVLLVLPSFDGTGSLGSLARRVVYPLGSTLGDCLPFPCGE